MAVEKTVDKKTIGITLGNERVLGHGRSLSGWFTMPKRGLPDNLIVVWLDPAAAFAHGRRHADHFRL